MIKSEFPFNSTLQQLDDLNKQQQDLAYSGVTFPTSTNTIQISNGTSFIEDSGICLDYKEYSKVSVGDIISLFKLDDIQANLAIQPYQHITLSIEGICNLSSKLDEIVDSALLDKISFVSCNVVGKHISYNIKLSFTHDFYCNTLPNIIINAVAEQQLLLEELVSEYSPK